MRDAAIVVVLRKLGDRQATVVVDDGRLGAGATEWRALIQQESQVFGGFGVGQYRVGGVEERRQPDQGRHTIAADAVIEGLFAFPAVPERANSRPIVDGEEVVDLGQGALLPGFAKGAPDQLLAPAVRGGVAQSARQCRLVGGGVYLSAFEPKVGGIQGESLQGSQHRGYMAMGPGTNDVEGLVAADKGLVPQEASQGCYVLLGLGGEVGDGAFPDLAVLALSFAQEDGGRGVAVGNDVDVHGNDYGNQNRKCRKNLHHYMGTYQHRHRTILPARSIA